MHHARLNLAHAAGNTWTPGHQVGNHNQMRILMLSLMASQTACMQQPASGNAPNIITPACDARLSKNARAPMHSELK